ncbi:MAG: Smr/MutS family protein [Cocleimonas sp.]
MVNFDKKNLKALKKQLKDKQRSEEVVQQKKQQQKQIDNLDQDYFQDAMQGVSPLVDDTAYHVSEKVAAKRIRHQQDDELMITDPLSDELEVTEVTSEDTLSFCQTGIQKSVFRKLRAGNYRISDELDLHGTNLKQAKQILVYYLQEAVQFESCCVRIIHGKGHRSGNNKPVLKTYVNHWLQEHPRVLAFHTCKSRDGGAGAVYVLLRRS